MKSKKKISNNLDSNVVVKSFWNSGIKKLKESVDVKVKSTLLVCFNRITN